MDDELSPRARRLVEVAMEQDLPADGVADDSWGMVVSRVSVDTERSRDVAPLAATHGRAGPTWVRGAVGVAIVVAMVGAAWLALRPTPVASPQSVAPRRSTAIAPTPPAGTPAAPPSADHLLDQADAALPIAPTRALELVDRHAALAPATEAERRMALRISVLCELGRSDEARAEATAFLARPRAAEWTERVRASCGGAPERTGP